MASRKEEHIGSRAESGELELVKRMLCRWKPCPYKSKANSGMLKHTCDQFHCVVEICRGKIRLRLLYEMFIVVQTDTLPVTGGVFASVWKQTVAELRRRL